MIDFLRIRRSQLTNHAVELLIEFPFLISVIIIVPVVIYFILSLAIPNELLGLTLNSNIIELIKSFNILYYQASKSLVIIAAVLYVFFNRFNTQIFLKYKCFPISFVTVTKANIVSLILILDIFLALILVVFSIIIKASFASSCVFTLLMLVAFNATLIVCFILFGCISWLVKYVAKVVPMFLCNLIGTLVVCLILLERINRLFLESIMTSNSFYILALMLLLSIVPFLGLNRVSVDRKYLTLPSSSSSKAIIIFKDSDISVAKSHGLSILNNASAYIEYALSLSILFAINLYTNVFNVDDPLLYSWVILIALTSNGIFNQYMPWYRLRNKKVRNQILFTDAILNICVSLVLFFGIGQILNMNISLNLFLIFMVSNLICFVTQLFLKFSFEKERVSSIQFTGFYAIYSTIVIIIVKEVLLSCIK